jgi:beta-ureidopropionase / N-carbamoyl-L-amino-acid hydrolase
VANPLRINGPRLLARLQELGRVGGTGNGGCARLALTDADRLGRDLVVAWMQDLGLEITVDTVGNVVAVWPGANPDLAPVMCGSHIDTVATGGIYDGNLGVLAGLEIIETLQSAEVSLSRGIAVGVFTNEEGARFAPDMLGSLAYVGALAVEDAHDIVAIDGARFGDELQRIGYLGAAPCPGFTPHAFVELHIEQGPVLEAEGTTIGVVTGVQGISWQRLQIMGQSRHAGTTPISLRHDPGYVACEIGSFARRLANEFGPPQVATVGRIDLHPNLINVVAASATMTVDLRHTDEAVLQLAETRMAGFVAVTASNEGVTVQSTVLARFEPVSFSPEMIDLIESIATAHGRSTMRLPSGAGHDAQMFARICPTGMIFTQSAGGISHNPAEHTELADLEAGANVLLDTLLYLAQTKDDWNVQ